ncbi:MAG: single-stranded DNA-binding protein [Oscillospiraceae bacterium]
MDRTNDAIRLCGEVAGRPELSHTGREGAYYRFPLAVRRLSGTEDVLNVVLLEQQLKELEVTELPRLKVWGEVRSFNNRSGVGPKLVITVLARALKFTDDDFENTVLLSGSLCKPPTLRRTPMGREICDLMLAVNRNYGRSDYLPCIAWGAMARNAAQWDTGTQVDLMGRLQSRSYIKMENDVPVEKTAYEISAVSLEAH